MTWLLVIIITGAYGPTVHAPMGEMVNEKACRFAGEAVAEELSERVPDVMVTFSCIGGTPA